MNKQTDEQTDEQWAADKLRALLNDLTERAAGVLEWSGEICWLDLFGDLP